MATTYKASFDFSCWKQHTCVQCNESYQYVLMRKVQGSAGSEQAAFAAAQNAAVKAMEEDVDQHPCPKCGRVQPDMVAAIQRPWYGTALAIGFVGVAIGFFPGLAHGFTIEISAWVATVAVGLALVIAFLGSMRNPNANQVANQTKSAQRLEDGVIRLAPPGMVPDVEPTDGDEFADSSSASGTVNVVALGMFVVAALAVLAAPLVRMASGWPLNERWYPAVIGPGDTSTFYFQQDLRSLKGMWHAGNVDGNDTVGLVFQDPAAIGLQPDEALVLGSTKDKSWKDEIEVENTSGSSRTMWATVPFPENEALENAEADVTVSAFVIYPAPVNDTQWEEKGKDFTESDLPLKLATSGAGGSYHQIWLMGQIAAMALCLFGGIGLLKSAGGLVNVAYPTAVFPLEDEGENVTDIDEMDDIDEFDDADE